MRKLFALGLIGLALLTACSHAPKEPANTPEITESDVEAFLQGKNKELIDVLQNDAE